MGYWREEAQLNEIRRYADIGVKCNIASHAAIDGRRPSGRVRIGDRVTITEGCMLLCHDAAGNNFGCESKFGETIIGDDCFIGIRTVILPGVNIGTGSIVGACSVVTKDIPSGQVWAGNPAKFICTIEEYKKKHGTSVKEFR